MQSFSPETLDLNFQVFDEVEIIIESGADGGLVTIWILTDSTALAIYFLLMSNKGKVANGDWGGG